MYSFALYPISVPADTSALRRSPVEICTKPNWRTRRRESIWKIQKMKTVLPLYHKLHIQSQFKRTSSRKICKSILLSLNHHNSVIRCLHVRSTWPFYWTVRIHTPKIKLKLLNRWIIHVPPKFAHIILLATHSVHLSWVWGHIWKNTKTHTSKSMKWVLLLWLQHMETKYFTRLWIFGHYAYPAVRIK